MKSSMFMQASYCKPLASVNIDIFMTEWSHYSTTQYELEKPVSSKEKV